MDLLKEANYLFLINSFCISKTHKESTEVQSGQAQIQIVTRLDGIYAISTLHLVLEISYFYFHHKQC